MLSNPCTLACEHSFCKECIDRMTKLKENLVTLICPFCEKEQVIESGFCNLKPSRLLKQMLDRAKGYIFQNLSGSSKMVFLKSFRYTHLFNMNALLLNKLAILSNLFQTDFSIWHYLPVSTSWSSISDESNSSCFSYYNHVLHNFYHFIWFNTLKLSACLFFLLTLEVFFLLTLLTLLTLHHEKVFEQTEI